MRNSRVTSCEYEMRDKGNRGTAGHGVRTDGISTQISEAYHTMDQSQDKALISVSRNSDTRLVRSL